MGIDIYCSIDATGKEQELTDQIVGFFQRLESAIPQPEPQITHYEDAFEVTVFFAADPILFHFEEDRLEVSVRTSNAGPGYHAYVVNLLKKLEQSSDFCWEPEEISDETGYWQSGNFVDVQSAMADWLHSLGSMLMERFGNDDGVSNLALGMPLDCLPAGGGHFAVYSLGALEKQFFSDMLATADMAPFCQRFFLWWNEGLDAEFYLKYALYLIWNNINWLPPAEDDEVMLFNNALHSLETAWRMDPALPLPLAEWYELAMLGDDESLQETLRDEFSGIEKLTPSMGHLRGKMTMLIGGVWNITVPGQMHKSMDNNTLVFWSDDLTLRVSHLRVNKDDGMPVPAGELLANLTEDYNAQPYTLPGHDTAVSRLLHGLVEEKGQEPYHDTTLFAAIDGSILILSCYYDNEGMRDAAMEIVNSVKNSSVNEE